MHTSSFGEPPRKLRRRRGTLVVAGATAIGLLGAGLAGFTAPGPDTARAAETPPPGSESSASVDRILEATQNDPLHEAVGALASARVGGGASEFPGVFAGVRVVDDGMTLEVLYNETGPASLVSELLRRVAEVNDKHDVDVVPSAVDFDPDARSALALRISEGGDEWTSRLGVSSISFVGMDTVTGEISVMTPDTAPLHSRVIIDSIPVTIVVSSATVVPQPG